MELLTVNEPKSSLCFTISKRKEREEKYQRILQGSDSNTILRTVSRVERHRSFGNLKVTQKGGV